MYFVLFSDRLGRVEGYSTYRYNLIPFEEIRRFILYTFLFTLSIETMQLITRVGVFDVDDLLMNTLGGIGGWICYRIALCVYRQMYKRKVQSGKKKG